VVESFLPVEVGPLRQNHLILQGKRENSSEKFPLRLRYFWRNGSDQIESKGKPIHLEERTCDVVEYYLVQGRLSLS